MPRLLLEKVSFVAILKLHCVESEQFFLKGLSMLPFKCDICFLLHLEVSNVSWLAFEDSEILAIMSFSSECVITGKRRAIGMFACGYNFKQSKWEKALIGRYYRTKKNLQCVSRYPIKIKLNHTNIDPDKFARGKSYYQSKFLQQIGRNCRKLQNRKHTHK